MCFDLCETLQFNIIYRLILYKNCMIYAIYISLIFIRKNNKKKQRVYRLQIGCGDTCGENEQKYIKKYVKTESEVRER